MCEISRFYRDSIGQVMCYNSYLQTYVTEEALKDVTCLSIHFDTEFIARNDKDEITELFTCFDWKKMPHLNKIHFYSHSSFLAKYLPSSVDCVEFDISDLYDVEIYSNSVRTIIVSIYQKEDFDPTFFERLPVSVESICIDVMAHCHDMPSDYIFKYGYHNLPPGLKYFSITIHDVETGAEYYISDEWVERIKKCFTFGPNFLCLTLNTKKIFLEKKDEI